LARTELNNIASTARILVEVAENDAADSSLRLGARLDFNALTASKVSLQPRESIIKRARKTS
jgi:hypothetical protein